MKKGYDDEMNVVRFLRQRTSATTIIISHRERIIIRAREGMTTARLPWCKRQDTQEDWQKYKEKERQKKRDKWPSKVLQSRLPIARNKLKYTFIHSNTHVIT